MIHVHPLAPDVRLDVAPAPAPLSADVAARIDALWAAEQAARGEGLFDGPIFSVLEHAPARLTLEPVTYRRLIAARRDPELRPRIGLRPLGVTGLLLGPDGLALGRRSARLHTEAGRWEPAPAGVVDRPDWRAVLRAEAWEELGLKAADVSAPEPVALIQDDSFGVFDLLVRLRTPLNARQIEAAWRAHGSDEYDELAVLAPDALRAFRDSHEGIAALGPMLTAAGLLGR